MHKTPCMAYASCEVVDYQEACRLNWKVAKAHAEVATGDVIACRGKGRLEVGEITTTKKGRFAIDLTRFI